MEGGGSTGEGFKLGDIGDYKDSGDLWPIISAAIVTMNLSVLATKFGGIGGLSLNSYFDTFGLEGLLANTSWIVILFQIARWAYTSFYTNLYNKPWSPFVFVVVLLAVQIVHDLIFYYGLLNYIPLHNNDMLDSLRRYSDENGRRALGSHSTYFILSAVIAMYLKETSFIFGFIIVNVALYLLPFLLTTVVRKTPPAPQQQAAAKPAQKETFDGRNGGFGGVSTGDRRIQSWNSLRD